MCSFIYSDIFIRFHFFITILLSEKHVSTVWGLKVKMMHPFMAENSFSILLALIFKKNSPL